MEGRREGEMELSMVGGKNREEKGEEEEKSQEEVGTEAGGRRCF